MKFLKAIKHFFDYIVYYPIYKIKCRNSYKILSNKKTVDKIVNKNLSLARYGDGEFKWLLNIPQKSFQDDNEELTNRLKEVLTKKNKSILIGIPSTINSLDLYTYNSRCFWSKFYVKYFDRIKEYLSKDKIYACTNITRPYMGFIDKDYKVIKKKFNNIKRIWDKRNVLVVEGNMTKLGVGNDLFDNANSIKRIICPSKNAFNKYKDILNSSKKYGKDRIVLIALGPTATVLSYDLSLVGIQAIDIGHIDIEYMWFLNGAKTKTPVQGKFVNEARSNIDEVIDSDLNKKYQSEIIFTIE